MARPSWAFATAIIRSEFWSPEHEDQLLRDSKPAAYKFYCIPILPVAFVKNKLLNYTLVVTDSVKLYSVDEKQDLQISLSKKGLINFDTWNARHITNCYSISMNI